MNKKNFFLLAFCSALFVLVIQSFAPKNNLRTQEIKLGQLLFFDTRLSVNNTTSCATCHAPQLGFTDGLTTPKGAFGDIVKRNTPTLINLRDNKIFNWADSSIHSLQQQSTIPLFGKHPVEMGMDSSTSTQLAFILNDEKYKDILKSLQIKKIDWLFVKNSIVFYVKTFTFYNSKYDQYLSKKIKLSVDEKKGMDLFFSAELSCTKCHGGKDFDEPENPDMYKYQNIGLYNIGSKNDYAITDNGIFDFNGDTTDKGRFKIPSLRNIAITAPYFHDGSAKNLLEVITTYSNGGREIIEGINKGDGREHPNKHPTIGGFDITAKQKIQLIAFLKTLTDTGYLRNNLYKNPFK